MSDSTFKPLTITPVAFSLTEGTNIPAPPDSPPPTPGREADAGSDINGKAGGPLSSHPTTPEGIPGAFPPSPSTDAEKKDNDDVLGSLPPNLQLSPNNNTQKRPSSVRRLLSLRSIRSEKERHSEFGTPTSPLSPTDSKMSADDYSSSGRPGSPYTISTIMSSNSGKAKLSRKRSSAWFGSGDVQGYQVMLLCNLERDIQRRRGMLFLLFIFRMLSTRAL
ncbi:hypothetical protein EJ08DRAFT_193628 [Tothia fuscella]|uniref:Uncharacterized protein n=1 Tax=Tothia fuscella TaxID=1048955 RepID=A0A9P4NU51_9PEZI|nr:hypothetical protein EJ08DRAFT_193628 [Tothia fuscella]